MEGWEAEPLAGPRLGVGEGEMWPPEPAPTLRDTSAPQELPVLPSGARWRDPRPLVQGRWRESLLSLPPSLALLENQIALSETPLSDWLTK